LDRADFFLFPTLKTTLKRHCFQDIEEVKENVTRQLGTIKQIAFQEAFQKWKKRCQHPVASGGDYFEGTVCENDVSYLLKLFYSQFGLLLNTLVPALFMTHNRFKEKED
jgi:hypothetical protein